MGTGNPLDFLFVLGQAVSGTAPFIALPLSFYQESVGIPVYIVNTKAVFLSFRFVLFIGKAVTETKWERQRSFVQWFTPPMAASAELSQAKATS